MWKNRFIGYNLRQIQDIIDYADEVHSQSAIIFLDFRKAYATIEWPFLFSSLKHFGFEDDFIAWIQTLYKHPPLYIYNNGWKSQPILPQSGIRQESPISSLLFFIAADVMALGIRTSTFIHGIKIKPDDEQIALKIAQLADDTTLFLDSVTDIEHAKEIIEDFGRFLDLS